MLGDCRFSRVLCTFTLLTATCNCYGPITQHFEDWLKRNGYENFEFARKDYGKSGSFGGRKNDDDLISHTPVIYIHGNSDAALSTNLPEANGFQEHLAHMLEQGYSFSSLYATSWQDNNPANVFGRTHDCATVSRLRKFVEAVLEYTGAERVNIVSHSMGVTLARKVIKGGIIYELAGTTCDIGTSIAERIEVHVAMSGANQGLCNCHGHSDVPTCNPLNGFWPGDHCFGEMDCRKYPIDRDCDQRDYSRFMMDLNDGTPEGFWVFSVWSEDDELIKSGCWTFGQQTCRVPGSHGEIVYKGMRHIDTRDLTAADVHFMLTQHKVPSKHEKEL